MQNDLVDLARVQASVDDAFRGQVVHAGRRVAADCDGEARASAPCREDRSVCLERSEMRRAATPGGAVGRPVER
jgi:hypothetical protein